MQEKNFSILIGLEKCNFIVQFYRNTVSKEGNTAPKKKHTAKKTEILVDFEKLTRVCFFQIALESKLLHTATYLIMPKLYVHILCLLVFIILYFVFLQIHQKGHTLRKRQLLVNHLPYHVKLMVILHRIIP